MGRVLRKGVLFTLLFAGVVAPAAADPLLMFLLGVARQMVETHASRPEGAPTPEVMREMPKVYPGTAVEPDDLKRLIDDSFLYLSDSQRREIFGLRFQRATGAFAEARAEKAGTGYQTMMNEALRQYLSEAEPPVTETILRHVLRQEIPEYIHGATPRAGGRQRRGAKRGST